jgi:RTA1 like protein
MVDSKVTDFKLYRYTPSLGAAIVFIICFGICAAFHGWKIFRKRIFYFIPVLIGALCKHGTKSSSSLRADHSLTVEVVGYTGRAVSSANPLALSPFITQALTILLAPPLFAASIYMVLGRTIVLLRAEHHSVIPAKWLTKVFVGGDVLSFLTQSAGGGIQTGNTLAAYNLGENLIIAGLGIQLASFGFFIIVAGIFHFKIAWEPTPIAMSMGSTARWRPSQRSWPTVLWTLYVVSLLIFIRSVFRLIEYAGGNDGYLISHEYFLYIFDALLMLGVLVILIIFHPAEVIPGKKDENGGHLELN